MPIERARSPPGWGGIRRRLRKRRAANGAFDEALAIFESIGGAAVGSARQGRDRLPLAASARHRPLDPAERRVAGLAASGPTTVGSRRRSWGRPRTSEAHLGLLPKLGSRSRTARRPHGPAPS
jgi:hypothetical protein